jgi:hypothetical protein
MPKKKPTQLELFAGVAIKGQARALGLLGWDDLLWTQPIEIKLLSGDTLWLNLETIRRLHCVAKSLDPASDRAAAAKPARS